mmetsp:Transcript_92189/g.266023  ORF Transcript_92189/g.266023 Transcript_92189/m.266023 type:complete len:237 (+) Transcript_92189:2150-2860(+)
MVSLRSAGLCDHGRDPGGSLQGLAGAAQDQDGGVGLSSRVRRGAGQGPRLDRYGEGLQHVHLRQRRRAPEARGALRLGHRRGDLPEICGSLPHVLYLHGEAPPAHRAMAGGAPGWHRVLAEGRRGGRAWHLRGLRGDDGAKHRQLQVRVARGRLRRGVAEEVPPVCQYRGDAELGADRVHRVAEAAASEHLRLAGHHRARALLRNVGIGGELGVDLCRHGGGLSGERRPCGEARLR